MSKHTIQQIANYAALAEAAYANFARSEIDLTQQNLDKVKEAIQNAINAIDSVKKDVPKIFAKHITDNYKIIAHYADRVENGPNLQDKIPNAILPESGFSATLFQDKNGENKGQYVLAIRGSWGDSDVYNTDVGDIFANGVGYEQIADLYNFYMQLITPVGKKYKAARVLESDDSVLARLTARHQAAINELHSVFNMPSSAEVINAAKAKVESIEKEALSLGFIIEEIEPGKNRLRKPSNSISLRYQQALDNLNAQPLRYQSVGLEIGDGRKKAQARVDAILKEAHEQGYILEERGNEFRKIEFVDSDELYKDELNNKLLAGATQRALGLGLLSKDEKLVVSGHSLGGHLSAAFARLFPQAVDSVYMVNGAGFGSKSNPWGSPTYNINTLFETLSRQANKEILGIDKNNATFPSDQIMNIIGDKNWDFVAQDNFIFNMGLTQPTRNLPEIFIEKAGFDRDVTFGHGMPQMTDTMMVSALFAALDSSLNNLSVAEISEKLTPIFRAATFDDSLALERIVYALDKLINGANAVDISKENNREQLHKRLFKLKETISTFPQAGNLKILPLTSLTEANIVQTALSDSMVGLAYRYALRELNPFAVIGFDYSKLNQNQELNLYSADTPNGMSEVYIQKRAEMLRLMQVQNMGNTNTGEINKLDRSYYADLTSEIKVGNTVNIADGAATKVVDAATEPFDKNPVTLFGTDKSDTQGLTGGIKDDFIFGGAGSDTLIGGLGEDYLEGGAGNDTLYAGTEPYDTEDKSTNTLFGGLDSDTLYGAAGNDILYAGNEAFDENDTSTNRLHGNGGSDILYGGAGMDMLYGADDMEGATDNSTDFLYGGKGSDSLYGGAGDDFLFAGNTKKGEGDTSDNMLDGGAGNDYLYGDWGNDTLKGGAGRDNLYGNGGLDTYEGGEGGDNYYIRIGAGHGSVLNDTGVGDKIYVVDDEGNTTRLRGGKRDKDKLPDRTFMSEDGKYIFYVDENNTLTILLANDVKKAGNGDYKKGILKLMPEETASPSRPHTPKPSPNGSGSGSGGTGSGSGGTGSGSGGNPAGDGQGGGSDPEPIPTPKPRRATIPNYKNGDYGLNLKDDPKEPDPYPAPPGDSGRATNPDQKDGRNASSPIIIDLNGDGVQTYARDSQIVRFDLDNNGFAERTGWIDEYDGFLVRDLNGDGRINNGSELFGNHTLLANGKKAANGFDALKELDSNGDGKITRADDAWSELHVWQDRNQDAWSAKGELYTLDELGITELNTEYTTSKLVDSSGNAHKQQSNAVTQDGSSVAVTDVWFATNLADTQQIHKQVVSDEISKLPEIRGFGNVPDLHQAMMNNDALKQAVKNYLTADKEQRQQLLDSLIYLWAGSDKIDAKSRGDYIDARRLVALEALTGEPFLQNGSSSNPFPDAGRILTEEYQKFARYVAANLDAFGNPIFKQVIDDETGIEIYDWSDLYAQLNLEIAKNPDKLAEYTNWVRIAKDLITYSGGQQPKLDLNQTTLINQIKQIYLQTPKEAFVVLGKILANASDLVELRLLLAQYIQEAQQTGTLDDYMAALGNDAIKFLNATQGTDKDDVLQDLEWTGKKDVRLSAGAGNDTLIGGMGNDYLAGGDDADTYVFAKGHGSDKVYDSSKQSTVQFTDVNFADVKFRREGSNLVLFGYNGDDSVRLLDYMISSSWNDSVFQFADKIVTTADLMKNGLVLQGNDTNESIYGWSGRNEIYGAAGNDKIVTYGADDVLDGGAGNDDLYGGAGNDTLIGGAGNDYLAGGDDADTYVFAKGHGSDKVYDSSKQSTVQFTDVNFADVKFRREGSNLVLFGYNGDDSVRLLDYMISSSWNDSVFQFADKIVTTADLMKNGLVLQGNDTNESISGWSGRNEIYGAAGNDTIVTYGADDVLDGGAGDDKLYGGDGNDTLIGGAGNDYLVGSDGSDTYVFNQGFGQDTVYDYGSSDKNVLQFNGINAADISAQKSGSDLLLTAADGSSVKVQNYFYGTSYGAESFVFSDGTVNRADVDAYFAKAGNNLVQSMASFGVQNEATSASVSDNTVMNLPVLAAPAVS